MAYQSIYSNKGTLPSGKTNPFIGNYKPGQYLAKPQNPVSTAPITQPKTTSPQQTQKTSPKSLFSKVVTGAKNLAIDTGKAAVTTGEGVTNLERMGISKATGTKYIPVQKQTPIIQKLSGAGANPSEHQYIGSAIETGALALGPEGKLLTKALSKVAPKVAEKVTSKIAGKGATSLLTKAGVKGAQLAPSGGVFGAGTGINAGDKGTKLAKDVGVGIAGGAVLGGVGHVVGGAGAKVIQKGIDSLGYKTGFTNHVTNYVNHALTVADESKASAGASTKEAMGKLSQAEKTAKNPPTKLLTAPSQPKLLTGSTEAKPKLLTEGKQNFTIQSQEDQRVMNGTEKLAKEYDKEYKRVTTAFANSPKRMQSEVDKLDQKYIGRHSDLLNGVGEFATQTPKTKVVTPPKTASKPMTTNTLLSKVKPKSETIPVKTKPVDIPIQPVSEGEKVSGSALKSEQRAVEAGLTKEFKDKATYSEGSYKEEAANAVKLVSDNPKEAMDIAMGRKAGNNTIHEVAVAKALENKAITEGDGKTLRELATSPRHSETSESAQRLGAEGYDVTDHSPIKAIQRVLDARAKVAKARTGKTIEKVTTETSKAVKASTPKVTRQNWSEFVESIRC